MGSNIKIRFKIILYLLVVILIVIILRLYFMQIMSGELYAEMASEGITREKTVAAPRGNIYDRNGKLIVKSVPVTAVAAEPHIVLENEDEMEALSDCLNMSYQDIKEKLEKSNVSYINRVILKQDIDTSVIIYLAENSNKFPGVEIIDVYLRGYNFDSLASHLLGYTVEIDEDRLRSKKYEEGYEGGDQIGITGLEEAYESILKGKKGRIVYEVNPLGMPVDILKETSPTRGNDLYLTIDIDLQRVVEEILYRSIEEVRQKKDKDTDECYRVPGGAVVVLDPKTGEVLAMVSYPTFNPELFVGGISQTDWDNLNDSESHGPLHNRAIMSFPPGSAFKIVTAYGGLAEDIVNEGRKVNCTGTWLGLGEDFPKYCWKSHGSLNIEGAIKESCNYFFYQVGYKLFMKLNNAEELLQKYARIFGFGSETGIDIPYEDKGLVGDKEWKKDYFKGQPGYSAWFPGDTVNMAIGQGDLQVTPLQMAQAFSILTNRGIEYSPYIVKDIRDTEGNLFPGSLGEEYKDLKLNEYFIEIIEDGLVQVVGPGGTAAGAFRNFPLDRIPVAGKTGTAEIEGRQDYGWFASYAPVDSPEYVVVVMLEEAGSGGSSAAPIAEKIYRYIFNID